MMHFEVSYRGALLAGLAVLTIIALVKLWPIILLVLSAFIFVAALLPFVDWLARRGIPRTLAVLGIFAAIIAIIVGLFAVMVPAMIDEFGSIEDDLPEDARQMEEFLADFGIDVELQDRARDFDWSDVISGSEAVDYGQRILAVTLSVITVFVLTMYLLVDMPRLSRFMYQFVPPGKEPQIEKLLTSLGRVVGGYVRAQVITSFCIAGYTFAVLFALGVDNAVAFAVLAGFADILPLVGALIATVPPVVAAWDESPTIAVIVLVLLFIYQQFEDRYLTPRVYGQNLNLPPLIVLITVLSGARLFGVVGVLLALPAAGVARVAMDYFLDMRTAGIAPPGPTTEPLAPDNAEGA